MKYPLIQGILTQNGGGGETTSQVPFVYDQRKTPAEIMLLLHVHNAAIGSDDEVLSNVKWTGDVEMAEDDLRRDLSNKYGAKLVQTMFPGSLPTTTHYPDARAEWKANHDGATKVIEEAKDEAAAVDQSAPAPVAAAEPAQVHTDPLEGMDKTAVRDRYKELHPEGKNAPGFWDEEFLRYSTRKMIEAAKAEAD